MSSAPVIRGAPAASNWTTVCDYPASRRGSRVLVTMGPVAEIGTRLATLKTTYAVESHDISVTPGSAVATIRVTYNPAPGVLPLNERRWPVYSLQPSMVQVALKAHPQLASVAVHFPAVDRLIAADDTQTIADDYADNPMVLRYARLVLAGVTTYEIPSHILSVTRYYASAPDLFDDFARINTVCAWGAIKTDGKPIPTSVPEPKFAAPHDGTPTGYEWRLLSVTPTLQRYEENVVQWQFQAYERFAKWFYRGGTWEPATLPGDSPSV